MVLGLMRSEAIQQNYKHKVLGFSIEACGSMFVRLNEQQIMNRGRIYELYQTG
jgi:hypothetical protein